MSPYDFGAQLAKLAAEPMSPEQAPPEPKHEPKHDPGVFEANYLAALPGLDAQQEAARQVLRSGETGFYPWMAKLNDKVLPLGRRSVANQATTPATRWLSDLGLGGNANLIDLAAAVGGGQPVRERTRRLYDDSGIDEFRDRPQSRQDFTARETPWHKMQQGNMAQADYDVAYDRWMRDKHPGHYWLNPFLHKTGPLKELAHRWGRRNIAGPAAAESTAGRFWTSAIPLAGAITGGGEAQARLRAHAERSGLYGAGEGREVTTEERATAVKKREDEERRKDEEATEKRRGTKAAEFGYQLAKQAAYAR